MARAAELGRVTLLTNNGPLVGENLATLAPDLVPLFGVEHLRSSSSYGARKPDPRVFEEVLRAYDEPAEHTFFADDMTVNVEGARSVGITAHLYRDPASLLAAVEDFAARVARRVLRAERSSRGRGREGRGSSRERASRRR